MAKKIRWESGEWLSRQTPVCSLAIAAGLAILALMSLSVAKAADDAGVHGRVVAMDPSGKLIGAVADAAIEVKDQAGRIVANVKSGKNGYYKISLPPGSYYYSVRPEGYRDEDAGRGFSLKRSSGYASYTFSLVRGENIAGDNPATVPPVKIGRLEGRVVEKIANGETIGVPGAKISLRKPPQRSLTTVLAGGDERARYQAVMEVGVWNASVSATGYATLVESEPIRIDSEKTTNRDFVLTRLPPPSVVGQGVRGLVAMVSSSAGDSPQDIQINIMRPGGELIGEPIALSSPGAFSRDLKPGVYVVEATAAGFSPARNRRVFVFPGKYANVQLRLKSVTDKTPTQPGRVQLAVDVYEHDDRSENPPRPITGAEVIVRLEGQSLEEAARQVTGENGRTQFALPRTGASTVLARKEGFQPAGMEVVVGSQPSAALYLIKRPSGKPDSPITPVDPEKIAVAGYVVYKDPSSSTGLRGVEQTKLSFHPVDTRRAQSVPQTTSGRIGRFELKLPEGEYQLEVEPPTGFKPAVQQLRVTKNIGPQYVYLERQSQPGPANGQVLVRGYVVDDASKESDRRGVANVSLTWSRADRRAPEQTKATDFGGRFTITLPPGVYEVAAKPPAGYEPRAFKVDVRADMDRPYLELSRVPVRENARLIANVYERISSPTSIRFEPIGAARVIAFQGGAEQASAVSGRNGQATFNLKPGDYQVGVSHPKYARAVQSVKLTNATSIDFVLTRHKATPDANLSLTVQVYERYVAAGAFRFRPLDGARVAVFRGRTPVGQPTTSDAKGTAVFRLPTGEYRVVATKNGFRQGDTAFKLAFSMSAEVALERAATLPEYATLRLRAVLERKGRPKPTNPSGIFQEPAQGAAVMITQLRQIVARGRTDGRGDYSVRLRPGNYQVRVSHGETSRQETIQVGNNDLRKTIVIATIPTLPIPDPAKKRRFTLQLIDKHSNSPLPGLLRILKGNQLVVNTKTDPRGNYTMLLAPGDYLLQVASTNRGRKYKDHGQPLMIIDRDVTLRIPLQLDIKID